MTSGLFDKTINMLGNTLDLRASRHKLLSSNIANQETPGYRAVDIKFEDELMKRQGGLQNANYLSGTNPGHITIGSPSSASPSVIDRATDLAGYDQNSVGIEAEMARLSENTLMYNISAKILKSKFNLLMTAIKEGGR